MTSTWRPVAAARTRRLQTASSSSMATLSLLSQRQNRTSSARFSANACTRLVRFETIRSSSTAPFFASGITEVPDAESRARHGRPPLMWSAGRESHNIMCPQYPTCPPSHHVALPCRDEPRKGGGGETAAPREHFHHP